VRLTVTVGADTLPVEVVETDEAGRYRVRLGDRWLDVEAPASATGAATLRIDGAVFLVDDVREANGEVVVTLGAESYPVRVEEPGRRPGVRSGGRAGAGPQRLVAPMPGRVVAVHVAVGDRVAKGAPLVVLEAMKMENEFRAMADGTVSEVAVSVGQAVNAGDLLVAVGPASG
jgi:biotin carboxyl carrier protein